MTSTERPKYKGCDKWETAMEILIEALRQYLNGKKRA